MLSLLSSHFSLFSSLRPRLRNEAARGAKRGRYGVEEGRPLWLGPLAASFGDLWRPLWVCLLSSLFSLVSPLFSLLCSPCRRGFATPRSQESNYPLDSISSLLSLLSSLFPLLSVTASLLSSLLSLLSSLFSRCCSFLRSLFALVTSSVASGHRTRSQQPRPFAAPSLARRNARSDEIIMLLDPQKP